MADVSPSRSQLMSRVKGKNTKPELLVRKGLHRLGLRFRLHRPDLPGRPDIVLAKHQAVVFVHGCFWHRHAGCTRATTPKTRVEFWQKKFDANVARDKRNAELLTKAGWRVMEIWECETKHPSNIESLAADIKAAL